MKHFDFNIFCEKTDYEIVDSRSQKFNMTEDFYFYLYLYIET